MIKAGVMGWPVEHSLSPRLHGFWLAHYGIEGSYVRLPVKPGELDQAFRDLREQGFRGANITMPHKENALQFCNYVRDAARCVGAINTVVVGDDGTIEGCNTDVYGFKQNLLAEGYVPGGRPAVILGAGGAARAGVAALVELGVPEIRILNRTPERAEAVAEIFGAAIKVFHWSDARRALKDSGLLANATSLGMKGQPSLELSLNGLPPNAMVTDMINVPLETDLLKEAKQRGHKTADGLGMLLHQARPAFAAFFGREPEVTEELRNLF